MKRMASALTFLTRYDNEKNCFLKSIVTGDDTSQNIQTEFDEQENDGYGFLRQKRCASFDFMEQKTIINNKASLLQDSMLPLKSSTKQKKRHAFICLDDAQPICLIVLTNPQVTITFIES